MFNISLKLLILLKLYILYFCPTVQCNCEIEFSRDAKIIPRVRKWGDSTYIDVDTTQNKVEIALNNAVSVYCDTYFRYSEYFKKSCIDSRQKSLKLSCGSNGLTCVHNNKTSALLECVELNWIIAHKRDVQFPWCKNDPSSTTLLLTSKVNEVNIILAKACYDLKNKVIRCVNYDVQYGKRTNQQMLRSMRDVRWTGTDDLRVITTNTSLTTNHIWPLIYEVAPIVQGHSYTNFFQEYNDILNIIWRRNLRQGNWKKFIDKLENNAQNNSFQILTGTSGIVKNEANIFTIPEYIWSFVKSMDGRNENFVIFAYNFDIAETVSINDIILCTDICSEIPWLREISTGFRSANAGYMFCCKPDSIKDTSKLGGLPVEMFNNLD